MKTSRYQLIVIGGGHAGVEAACAAARQGCKTLLVTPVKSRISLMSCNPSVGGIAKGTLVREVDGLGGAAALSADASALQFRMLNMKKGPAVWGPRAQADVNSYSLQQILRLEEAGVEILEDMVENFTGPTERVDAVHTQTGKTIKGDVFVLAAGTFLGGMLHRGERSWPGGRRGDVSSLALEKDLRNRMFHVKRFKTGTSPRVLRRSIRTAALKEQESHDTGFRFSWRSRNPIKNLEKCWVTRTTKGTEEIVRDSLLHSPLYSGRITGKGPRYCPSFEDKITKFPERSGHPIHLEPMGAGSRLMYINGLSTSLPESIQEKMVRSLPGFENAVIASHGYSVEYTCFEKGEFNRELRLNRTENVYVAGQILGTSGYEEAAATGLLAGANAAAAILGRDQTVPDRMQSYLGVMVDDLVAKGAEEPYRLFSSRSENRLHLRQDNADSRVFDLGVSLGTVDLPMEREYRKREKRRGIIRMFLEKTNYQGKRLSEFCRRPRVSAEEVSTISGFLEQGDLELLRSVVLDFKYQGYIVRAEKRQKTLARYRKVRLDGVGDYTKLSTISIEAAEALNRVRPETLEQAETIFAVRQADIDALVIHMMKKSVSRET